MDAVHHEASTYTGKGILTMNTLPTPDLYEEHLVLPAWRQTMGIPAGSVGINIDPSATGAASALRLARLADESGLDFAGIQDHLYHPEFLDAWTLISTLTASTRRLTLMPNVANTVLRPPAPLIKAANTLSILSGGRIALGVGAERPRQPSPPTADPTTPPARPPAPSKKPCWS